MSSVTIKRSIGVQVIVTEAFKAELKAELQEAAEAGNERGVSAAITHLEEALGKVVSKLKDVANILGIRRSR